MFSRRMRVCPPEMRFHVYVLELGDGSLYVGTTAKSVRERMQEHVMGTGKRSGRSRDVRKYRADLSPRTVCATRERAEGIERRLAASLRRRGYEVSQG